MVVNIGREVCYWHLVGRDQGVGGIAKNPAMHREAPPCSTKNVLAPNVDSIKVQAPHVRLLQTQIPRILHEPLSSWQG